MQLHLPDFGIDNKQVTLVIHKGIAGKKIPCFIFPVGITAFLGGLIKTECCHICVDHNLCGGLRIGHPRLKEDGLYGATVETGKSIERIGGIGKNDVVKQYLTQQRDNAAVVIEKIVYLVDTRIGNIGVILVAARTRDTKTEYVHHGEPEPTGFGHLFGCPLFYLVTVYICFASARLRFIYSAKSFEFIGDFCDAAIFRILRSVTSLWNLLMNVMTHFFCFVSVCKNTNFSETVQIIFKKLIPTYKI